MLKKCIAMLLCAAAALAALTSCGSSKSGGTGEFTTVFVTATPPANTLNSDAATWQDATGKAATACVTGSTPAFSSDEAAYTINVAAYNTPNTGQTSPITTSDLIIKRITLTLTPANTSTPPLPAAFQVQYPSYGQRLSPGVSQVNVRIIPDTMKAALANDLLCTGATRSYWATVSFDMVEINTNRASTVTAGGLLVDLKDFADTGAQ